jgi:hypothetical protein
MPASVPIVSVGPLLVKVTLETGPVLVAPLSST